jgi:hypothetical protein
MLKWEYRTIDLSSLPPRVDEIDLLDDAGDQGWELVGITTGNRAYLKRLVAEPAAVPTMSPRCKAATKDV